MKQDRMNGIIIGILYIDPLSTVKGLMALPVGVYELSLAVWLIVKGFHKQKLEKLTVK